MLIHFGNAIMPTLIVYNLVVPVQVDAPRSHERGYAAVSQNAAP